MKNNEKGRVHSVHRICLTGFCEMLQLFHMSPTWKPCSQLAVASQDPSHRAVRWHFGLPHGSGGDWHCMQRTQREEFVNWVKCSSFSWCQHMSAYVTSEWLDLRWFERYWLSTPVAECESAAAFTAETLTVRKVKSCMNECRSWRRWARRLWLFFLFGAQIGTANSFILGYVCAICHRHSQGWQSWRQCCIVVQSCSDKWFQLRFPTNHNVKR